ncbi:unnamed protein product [Citrullus colocynthis]|uniref:RPA-interacting protein n=1 Tax=Citrullus colocynthis TaxID=252529 RepID=A0ABP0XV58_9ROSI
MEDDDPNSVIETHRSSIKIHPHYNNQQSWKQKLRENCCKRVREGRNRLLWKMRLPMSSPTYPHSLNNRQQDFIKSAFQDIFSDELKKIKDQSGNDYHNNLSSVPEAADVLWEYEGIQDAYQGEGEDILLEMQRIFYEDLNVDLRQKESEGPIVTWEDEEDEFLARAVYEHMQLDSEKVLEKLWCPICKQGELQENNHFIHCTRCGLRLTKGNEVTLDLLLCRLADVHGEHLDRGCRLKPKFCVESRFNITALYKNIVAVQTLCNMIMGSSLMATTSILLCAGLAAVLNSTYSIKKPATRTVQIQNQEDYGVMIFVVYNLDFVCKKRSNGKRMNNHEA